MQTITGEDRQMEERFDRIDEKFDRVNERLDEVNCRIREVKEDAKWRHEEVNQRFNGVEGAIVELRQGVAGMQATLNRFNASLAIAVIAVIVTIVLKGG